MFNFLSQLLGSKRGHAANVAIDHALGTPIAHAAETAIVTGIEATSPEARALIAAAEAIGAAPVTPISVLSAAGALVVAIDPHMVTQTEALLDAGITDALESHLSPEQIQAVIGKANAFVTAEFAGIGISAPVAVAAVTTTVAPVPTTAAS